VLSFEESYALRDPQYQTPPADTFATTLRAEAEVVRKQAIERGAIESALGVDSEQVEADDAEPAIDNEALYSAFAKEAVQNNPKIMQDLNRDGVPWGGLKACIKVKLPRTAADPDKLAYDLVPSTLNALFGAQDTGWHSFKNRDTGKTWVKKGPK
jgi:hypothetical protein